MAKADSPGLHPQDDATDGGAAARTIHANRWSAVVGWVDAHRRETAAAVIAGMMLLLVFDAPAEPAATRAPQTASPEAIDDLFAELDAARAHSAAPTTTDGHAPSSRRRDQPDAGVQHTAGWNGDRAPLRIPGNAPAQSPGSAQTPLSGADTGSSGGIRFSGLLRPTE